LSSHSFKVFVNSWVSALSIIIPWSFSLKFSASRYSSFSLVICFVLSFPSHAPVTGKPNLSSSEFHVGSMYEMEYLFSPIPTMSWLQRVPDFCKVFRISFGIGRSFQSKIVLYFFTSKLFWRSRLWRRRDLWRQSPCFREVVTGSLQAYLFESNGVIRYGMFWTNLNILIRSLSLGMSLSNCMVV